MDQPAVQADDTGGAVLPSDRAEVAPASAPSAAEAARPTGPRPPEDRRLRAFLALCAALGAGSVVVATVLAADVVLGLAATVVLVAVLVGAGHLVRVELPLADRTLAADLTETGVVLGMVLLPAPALVLPVAVGTVAAGLLRRRPVAQTTFNAAVNAVSAAVAAVVIALAGPSPLDVTDPAGLAVLLVALVAYGTVNLVCNALLLALLDGTAFQLTGRGIVRGGSVSLALSGSLGVLAAVLLAAAPLVLLALVLPAWIAYRALNERVARIREEVESRDRLARTVEGVSDGIALLDGDGLVELANPAFCSRLQVPVADALGRGLEELLPAGAVRGYRRTLAGLTPALPQGGDDLGLDDRVYALQLTGIFDRLGARTATVALLLDVTADREAEGMRQEFVARVSHELRTPLTSIRGFVETLRARGPVMSVGERERYLEIIERQTLRLERLVSALLWRSRIERQRLVAHPEAVEVVEVVHDALADLEDLLPGAVTVEGQRGLIAHADPDHLQQTLVNLLVNAATYGAAPIRIRLTEDAGEAVIEVSDGGDGVPEVFVGELFEPFAQASKGDRRTASGLGLGLSIVRSLAEQNGGSVTHDRVDDRTCFRVRLPSAAG